MTADIQKNLLDFIIEEAGFDDDEINSETLLFSEGYIDSFTMTSVIAFIEEEHDFEVDQGDIIVENFDTVNRMVTFIMANKA